MMTAQMASGRIFRPQPSINAAVCPEVAANQANPDEKRKRVTEDAIDGARPEIARSIPGHHCFSSNRMSDFSITGAQIELVTCGLGLRVDRRTLAGACSHERRRAFVAIPSAEAARRHR